MRNHTCLSAGELLVLLKYAQIPLRVLAGVGLAMSSVGSVAAPDVPLRTRFRASRQASLPLTLSTNVLTAARSSGLCGVDMLRGKAGADGREDGQAARRRARQARSEAARLHMRVGMLAGLFVDGNAQGDAAPALIVAHHWAQLGHGSRVYKSNRFGSSSNTTRSRFGSNTI